MQLLNDWSHSLARIRRAHPAIRHISLTTVALTVAWIYILRQGEREEFTSKVARCEWTSWESWPDHAHPHRAVMIADPQLVDAHTYPGRPWPLSSLTERYTDRYMARSFKLITSQLDPDSIIFLGDMFDGGREWAPSEARPLNNWLRGIMEIRSPATANVPAEASNLEVTDPGWTRGGLEKRAGGGQPAVHAVNTVEEERETLTKFVHGEVGRWKSYKNKYWEKEYDRFGRIFLAPDQLYPEARRELIPEDLQPLGPQVIDNGAKETHSTTYVMLGSKSRSVLSSLPGNHDIGFGSGVQWPIRARYEGHFGDLSRVDVLGNHTFVSVDGLSLAAWSQFEQPSGQESTPRDATDRAHIYATAQQFLDDLPRTAGLRTKRALQGLYPQMPPGQQKWKQNVIDAELATPINRPVSSNSPRLPVVLLTHVPLYREPDTFCGSQRERGRALSITGGYQYQNVLTPTLSNAVVQKINRIGPLAEIFSGDDHDYCNIIHEYSLKDRTSLSVVEETVKSFSWAMGVRHPGFMMVSLWNPIDEHGKPLHDSSKTIQTHLCLLPDQLAIFLRYASLAGITVLALVLKVVITAIRKHDSIEEDDLAPAVRISDLLSSSLQKVRSLTETAKPNRHRPRASSSALKPPMNTSLSVQRSVSARARSVSPGVGFTFPPKSSMAFQSNGFPESRQSSNYGSDDEESRIGDTDYLEDSQAKWRSHTRPRGKWKRAWDDFVGSLSLVACIAFIYYIVLIRAG